MDNLKSSVNNAPPVVIQPEQIFLFPDGIPAFEFARQFIFMINPETQPFIFMQAVDNASLRFVCVDPFAIYPDYKPLIARADEQFLGLNKADDLLLLSIVTVARDVHDTTANLQGPIALNLQTRIGKQVICEGDRYSVQYRFWEVVKAAGSHTQPVRGSGEIPLAATG